MKKRSLFKFLEQVTSQQDIFIGKQPSHMLALESRILLDAAAAVVIGDAAQHTATDHAEAQPNDSSNNVAAPTGTSGSGASATDHVAAPVAINNGATISSNESVATNSANSPTVSPTATSLTITNSSKEITFIDTKVQDYQTLLKGIDKNSEIVVLDPTKDGFDQIANVLSSNAKNGILYNAIHIVSEGQAGKLYLGNTYLTLDNLKGEYANDLSIIKSALTEQADILIYGCDFGKGSEGMNVVNYLAEQTGADIAASDNATGSAALMGDWIFEVKQGDIETNSVFDSATQQGYTHLLAPAQLDWDSVNWVPGNLNASYNVDGSAINLSITGDVNNFESGFPDDNSSSTTGGLNPDQQSLVLSVDYDTGGSSEAVTLTIDFTHPGGVSGINFSIFDIDTGSGTNFSNFRDVVTVIAYNGSIINPTLVTHGSSNVFDGINTVSGIEPVDSNSADGNAFFSFNQFNITQIKITYSSGLSVNPTTELIGIHDINFFTNQAPVLDLDASAAGTGFSTTYVENVAPVNIVDTDSLITDSDDSHIESAVIVLTNAQTGDVLSIAGALPAGISSSIISGAGQITVTLTGSATKTAYETALEQLRFSSTSDSPDTTQRIITIKVNDGTLDSNTAISTINVVSVNDAPSGADKTVTTLEDTAYAFTAADFGFSDANDNPANTFQAVRITTLPSAGALQLNGVDVNAGDFISVANINAGFLKFVPATNANGSGYASFTFQVQDNGGGNNLDLSPNAITINVTPVNDIPILNVASLTLNQGQIVTLSTANFSIVDPDNTSFIYNVNNISGGFFQLSTNPGVPISSFSSADLSNGLIQFVDNGDTVAPSFNVFVNDGIINSNSNTLVAAINFINPEPPSPPPLPPSPSPLPLSPKEPETDLSYYSSSNTVANNASGDIAVYTLNPEDQLIVPSVGLSFSEHELAAAIPPQITIGCWQNMASEFGYSAGTITMKDQQQDGSSATEDISNNKTKHETRDNHEQRHDSNIAQLIFVNIAWLLGAAATGVLRFIKHKTKSV